MCQKEVTPATSKPAITNFLSCDTVNLIIVHPTREMRCSLVPPSSDPSTACFQGNPLIPQASRSKHCLLSGLSIGVGSTTRPREQEPPPPHQPPDRIPQPWLVASEPWRDRRDGCLGLRIRGRMMNSRGSGLGLGSRLGSASRRAEGFRCWLVPRLRGCCRGGHDARRWTVHREDIQGARCASSCCSCWKRRKSWPCCACLRGSKTQRQLPRQRMPQQGLSLKTAVWCHRDPAERAFVSLC